MDRIDSFLLDADPWVRYRTWIDLKDRPEADSSVVDARSDMLAHPLVRRLLDELHGWPGVVISSHKSAGQQFHKLAFVAELGLTKDDPGMDEIITKVMANQSEEGPIQLTTNIPEHFGGSGKDLKAWALCDAPIILYALAKMGLRDDPAIHRGAAYLTRLVRDNGWPCAVSKELGNFRGPGRKSDPCPYADLVMLKLLLQFPEHQESPAVRAGAECLLSLWEQSREQHPFQFYMGTDFRKIKAPFIWHDILHVAEVLSQCPFTRSDIRMRGMLDEINAKADADGLFTPESVWQAWQGWDFAQKKVPSPWLTFLILRLNRRFE